MKFNVWNRELYFDIETKEITYNSKKFIPSIRTFWDMKNLYKSVWEDYKREDVGLYFMYRDVFFNDDDKKILKNNNIRYDITIILPDILWWELNKTYWHYHPKNSKWKDFEELYQVLKGEAIYLQQNKKEVFYTNAKQWDSVNMDESFWHITINPSKDNLLIMANLVDDTFSSIYNDYSTNKGWNYCFFEKWWEINSNYNNSLELAESNKKFPVEISIYDDFLTNPEKFNYLH